MVSGFSTFLGLFQVIFGKPWRWAQPFRVLSGVLAVIAPRPWIGLWHPFILKAIFFGTVYYTHFVGDETIMKKSNSPFDHKDEFLPSQNQ